eukprot:6188447-Pleurochrysis_carterae.AAC.6
MRYFRVTYHENHGDLAGKFHGDDDPSSLVVDVLKLRSTKAPALIADQAGSGSRCGASSTRKYFASSLHSALIDVYQYPYSMYSSADSAWKAIYGCSTPTACWFCYAP